jgi:hypothetical protein
MSQHTPGPWMVGKNGYGQRKVFRRDTGKCVATVHRPQYRGEPENDAQFIADLTLIAAAPELLGALKRAADVLARYPKHDAAWKQARDAITKATGV